MDTSKVLAYPCLLAATWCNLHRPGVEAKSSVSLTLLGILDPTLAQNKWGTQETWVLQPLQPFIPKQPHGSLPCTILHLLHTVAAQTPSLPLAIAKTGKSKGASDPKQHAGCCRSPRAVSFPAGPSHLQSLSCPTPVFILGQSPLPSAP